MMNNSIQHANADQIFVQIKQNYLYTEISITDTGIGIFKKVQNYLKNIWNAEIDYNDVIAELYKGKLTTDPSCHAGEGIFFSSKIVKEFAIWSDNTIYTSGFDQESPLIQSHLISYYTKLKKIGTMFVMKLENQTSRTTTEIFDEFAPIEEGFVKTRIPIKHVCAFGEPIARSQARRLSYRLDQFKLVEFDFTDVEFMGQGFADEFFRVWQNEHPEVQIIPINANRTIAGMIKHVTRR